MSFTLTEVSLVAACLFLAGTVKGVFGVGLPAVSMGLLALLMPPVEAAALLVAPGLVTNLWQFAAGPERFSTTRRFSTLSIAIAIGTALGIGVLSSRSPWAPLALGSVLMVYAAITMFLPPLHLPARFERQLSPLIGIITGVISGSTGVAAVPLVPYLNSLGLSREVLLQSMGFAFVICTGSLSICLAWTGHLHLQSLGTSVLAIVPAVAGMTIGARIRRRLHAERYRKWFLIGLLTLGAFNGIRAAIQLNQ
jgi:uncharacterized membrane protein YfcA